jgi:hypothetical protein
MENPAMRFRTTSCVVAIFVLAVPPLRAADDAYTLKMIDKSPPPQELQEPIRKLLADRSMQLLNAKGGILAEIWLRKDVPAKATDAQIKNGLTYREVPETSLFGAIRFPSGTTDYRKQKIPAGVYTLRLANQPQDGDHMGTAPFSDFLLLSPAAEDKKPDTMEPKALQELSGKTTAAHPGVLLLFPGKGAAAQPKLEKKEENHWIVLFLLEVKVGDKKATLPVGLTLIGASSSA